VLTETRNCSFLREEAGRHVGTITQVLGHLQDTHPGHGVYAGMVVQSPVHRVRGYPEDIGYIKKCDLAAGTHHVAACMCSVNDSGLHFRLKITKGARNFLLTTRRANIHSYFSSRKVLPNIVVAKGAPKTFASRRTWTRRNWKRKSATFRLSQLGASRVCNVEEVHSKCRVLGHRNSVGVIGWECWPGKRSWDGPRIFIRRLSRAKH